MSQPVDARSAPPSRAARKRAERMRLVEQAAARLFAERGYEGTNFDDVGAALDLRGSSLYYYYPSKDELCLRCIENTAGEVFGRLRTIADSDVDARECLRLLFAEQALISMRDFPEFVALFLKVQLPVESLAARRKELRREHLQIFLDVARRIETPAKADIDALRVRILLAIGALDSLPEWYNANGRLSGLELAERVSQLLMSIFDAA